MVLGILLAMLADSSRETISPGGRYYNMLVDAIENVRLSIYAPIGWRTVRCWCNRPAQKQSEERVSRNNHYP